LPFANNKNLTPQAFMLGVSVYPSIIGYKETNRLAQQLGSYTVLIYRRPVVRHKSMMTQ